VKNEPRLGSHSKKVLEEKQDPRRGNSEVAADAWNEPIAFGNPDEWLEGNWSRSMQLEGVVGTLGVESWATGVSVSPLYRSPPSRT